jgi:small ligand-binding sensory domain FIST
MNKVENLAPFAAAAVSKLESLDAAEREVIGRLQAKLEDKKPNVLIVAATPHHAAHYAELPERLNRAFPGAAVIGCSTTGVIARDGETEGEPALAVLAVGGTRASPFLAPELKKDARRIGRRLGQSFAEVPGAGKLLLLMPDAYVGSLQPLLETLASCYGPLPLVGGAPSEQGLGRTYQWGPPDTNSHHSRTISGGLSGVFLSGEFESIISVAQGCSPVGPSMIAEASGNVVKLLDGKPALEAFIARLPGPLRGDLPRAMSTVLFAVEEGTSFVARHLVGIEAEGQGLVLGEAIPTGSKLRLAIRDASSAREDMKQQLEAVKARVNGRRIVCGLYFSCTGRGSSLHGIRDLDASYIDGELGEFPWIGFQTSAEIAFVGSGFHVFAYSGVLALLVA